MIIIENDWFAREKALNRAGVLPEWVRAEKLERSTSQGELYGYKISFKQRNGIIARLFTKIGH